jgi:mono/diheme cytochrome c family protein
MRTHVARLILVLVCALAAGFVVACGSSSPSAPSQPTNTVTFSTQIQQQILNPACVACHTDDGRTPAGAAPGLNLKTGVSIANLVNAGSTGKPGAVRVIPGNPSGSYLIQKLEGAPDIVGLRMPRNGPPYLTTEQIALIRQWIQNGAPNN